MKAIQQQGYGDPDVLALAEVDEPPARPGRVRVRVTAAAVNPFDLAVRSGRMRAVLPDLAPPFIPGSDFAGTVIDGDGGFRPGARVAGLIPWLATREGAYAETISVDPAWLAAVPAGLDDVRAAAVPLAAQTARQALGLAGARAGRTVLITGASGAVGGFAVQQAVALGAGVVAVASAGDAGHVAGLRAGTVLERTGDLPALLSAARAVAPGGFDAVVDAAGIGGDLLPAIRAGGVLVALTGPERPPAERGIAARRLHVRSRGDQLADILAGVAAGRITVRVGAVLPLEQAAEAHRRAERRDVRGKVVLKVAG
ncbi:NADP-dependent oxidoreductase [Pseudosporangium ferrugineum]|uniref:NADPH:quinone reductase-like Zn-dependent oxidoreductase n=1 Tax=Pseudosporangium ferrugineum TaxID=439699 RepID=A0A2T0SBH1_9ACTN|nr:NADP-dependent oxidoreductase [Pseudosporangium ferrugineum]PRY30775.1 NADPH:quinone reductase-like Zn-dependent oxidoreductase [Pseudosporangium ferrugineum]